MSITRLLRLVSWGLPAVVLAASSFAQPVVPGTAYLDAAAGELLLGELNCISCHEHGADDHNRILGKSAPDLASAGARMTPGFLREFLRNPQAAKPGSTMPNVFHGIPEEEREKEVEELVHFLSSMGGPIKPSRLGGSERLVARGRELFHSVGCVACHAPEEGGEKISFPAVPLGKLAGKTTVDALSDFLLDPLKIRKSGRMPDLRLTEGEAHAIAVYLLRDQLKAGKAELDPSAKEFGVAWEYFEAPMGEKLPDFEMLKPTKSGTHGTITFNMGFQKSRQDFAMRWRAILRVPKDGEWTFFTVSDDGSQLLVNGELVVDNDGVHTRREQAGKIELKAGEHELEVRYFQKVSGAVFGVGWQGPGGRKERIPSGMLSVPRGDPMAPVGHEALVLDDAKAAAGAKVFSRRGCASCHQLEGVPSSLAAGKLGGLTASAGCLADAVPAGAPDYQLSEGQRSALRAALTPGEKGRAALTAGELVHRHLASMNCYACHKRGEVGGPDELRREFFKTTMEIDLGEEGKIPPNLNTVGSKFRREALEKILYHGALHVRGRFMATRMPSFGKENLEPLVDAFVAADAQPADGDAPEFNYGSARDGQALVGSSGLACITCHNVGGRQAIGIPGIDLAEVHQRLNPGWFKRFLHSPQDFNKDTRMPAFWPGGVASFKKIAGGDTNRQMEGIWNYLSLGKSMPPPPGMADEGGAGSELKPVLEPIVHRTFMTDVGPRAIVAGFPERVHVAFDANVIRLAKAWRGRFFDASGVASGRSDKFFGPLGTDVHDLPPGPAFAFLEASDTPWPQAAKTDRDVGGQFLGYSLTPSGEPVFMYELAGYEITEMPRPVMQPGGAILSRRLTVKVQGEAARKGLNFIAAKGQSIDLRESGEWSVDNKVAIKFVSEIPLQPVVRQVGDSRELLVPITLEQGDQLEFEVQIKW